MSRSAFRRAQHQQSKSNVSHRATHPIETFSGVPHPNLILLPKLLPQTPPPARHALPLHQHQHQHRHNPHQIRRRDPVPPSPDLHEILARFLQRCNPEQPPHQILAPGRRLRLERRAREPDAAAGGVRDRSDAVDRCVRADYSAAAVCRDVWPRGGGYEGRGDISGVDETGYWVGDCELGVSSAFQEQLSGS